jgi:alginate O-acetyltransferase complex protein AlgI
MAACSLGFLFFCGAAVIVFHLAPGKRTRQLVLACVSALFLASLVPDQRSCEWFAVTLAGTYLALVAVRRWRRGAVTAAAITLGLLLYFYLKRFSLFGDFVPVPPDWDRRIHPVELVGLSYMIFKFVHVLVDQWQGQLAPFNLWTYLNYQLSFFTLTAGPIQRYNDFLRYWEEMDLQPSDPRESLRFCIRLLTGMIKVGALGAYAHSALRSTTHMHNGVGLSEILARFYVYPVYLYFNFSGYTDIMLGVGGLLGFRLPENFNRPWLARNVLDFWDRWHISLTHWIRDYVFMASYKVAATRFPSGHRYWSYALLFFALFVAGVWHGTTDAFIVFGVLNGLGAATTRAYGDLLRATLGRQGLHAYLKNPTVRLIAVVMTLHYVCFCQFFFSSDLNWAMKMLGTAGSEIFHLPATLSRYSWHGAAIAMVVATLLLIALWNSALIGSVVEWFAVRFRERTGWLCAILFIQSAFVAGMFFIDWALQQDPPPVLYMAF